LIDKNSTSFFDSIVSPSSPNSPVHLCFLLYSVKWSLKTPNNMSTFIRSFIICGSSLGNLWTSIFSIGLARPSSPGIETFPGDLIMAIISLLLI
jgi:hypothetical protein